MGKNQKLIFALLLLQAIAIELAATASSRSRNRSIWTQALMGHFIIKGTPCLGSVELVFGKRL